MTWHQGKTERLIQMWQDGYSASVIAYDLGETRNSVVGKVFRLNLPKRTTHFAKERSETYVIKQSRPRHYVVGSTRRPAPLPPREKTKREMREDFEESWRNTAKL